MNLKFTNALAHSTKVLITIVKRFIVQTQRQRKLLQFNLQLNMQ